MMNIERMIQELKEYEGPELKIMEVCGTHTASIFKSGIRSLISPKLRLISGPGCPVCVTPSSYIDRCIDYAMKDHHVLVTFGDMMKVPGMHGSLSQIKGDGGSVELMYSPLEVTEKARQNPDITYVIAGVGFETTAPSYALTIEEAVREGIRNIRILTALKTVIPALEWICENEDGIGGFLCPGHVSVIIGSAAYGELLHKYNKPFVVAGFEPEHILAAIYDIVRQLRNIKQQDSSVHNLYKNAVRTEGNQKAQKIINHYFEHGDTMWRGLGMIPDSGLYLKREYADYDGGSKGLDQDVQLPRTCRCSDVIIGRANPDECKMFGKTCNPMSPYGPCMVSSEGACGIWYRNIKKGE
ncbi:MAG: hydrogenase formation protein HypD [Eubacteriales bacterium]|nr:hydrogenase formation protein HypD [Eubacteriales bacterium]